MQSMCSVTEIVTLSCYKQVILIERFDSRIPVKDVSLCRMPSHRAVRHEQVTGSAGSMVHHDHKEQCLSALSIFL